MVMHELSCSFQQHVDYDDGDHHLHYYRLRVITSLIEIAQSANRNHKNPLKRVIICLNGDFLKLGQQKKMP